MIQTKSYILEFLHEQADGTVSTLLSYFRKDMVKMVTNKINEDSESIVKQLGIGSTGKLIENLYDVSIINNGSFSSIQPVIKVLGNEERFDFLITTNIGATFKDVTIEDINEKFNILIIAYDGKDNFEQLVSKYISLQKEIDTRWKNGLMKIVIVSTEGHSKTIKNKINIPLLLINNDGSSHMKESN